MLFRLLQPVILISATNPCKQSNTFKSIKNKQLQSLHKDKRIIKNFILFLKQPKKVYKELASSKLKNIRKPGTYECTDKKCNVCI